MTSDGQRMPIYRQTVDKFGLIDTREKRTQTLFLLEMGQIFRVKRYTQQSAGIRAVKTFTLTVIMSKSVIENFMFTI